MRLSSVTACVTGVALAMWASAASAIAPIDFDAVTTGADVDGFYNGGTDSAGASGPDLGVQFVNFSTVTGFGETSQPNLAVVGAPIGIIDVAAGFQTGIYFTQGLFAQGEIEVYSGLDGTGLLLATGYLPPSNPYAFAPYSLLFPGSAESVIFLDSGGGGTFGIDDLELPTAVPEPATWAFMLIGVGALGAMSRTRRQRATAFSEV